MSRAKTEPILVIIAEHDVDDPLRSNGAIIFEQYTKLSQEEVIERAKMLAHGGKYGRIWTALVTDLQELKPGTEVMRRSAVEGSRD